MAEFKAPPSQAAIHSLAAIANGEVNIFPAIFMF